MRRTWLQIKTKKPTRKDPRATMLVTLHVPVAPGRWESFSATVDLRMVMRALRRAGIQVGFLGKLWRGVKNVAKKIGVDKVVKLASSVVPFPANLAVKTAADLGKAVFAKRKGKRSTARRYAHRAHVRAAVAKARYGKKRTRRAVKAGRRLYKVMVQPV